jgi:diguanylate cyclase (GGDEF)-like protein
MPSKVELLGGVSIFSDLSESDLQTVARYCRYYRYDSGEVIFEEGSRGEKLYIIQKGEVLITKHRGENDMDIARFIAGESFGELELLDEAPHTTVATAQKPCSLLQFPGKDIQFRDLLERHASIFAPVLHRLLVMIAERIRSTNKLISENSPWVQDLRRQLHTDKLTGLYNRTYLEEDFAELLPMHGEGTALIMVKPDRFKDINDRFGHEAGDRVLQAMAAALRSTVDKRGSAARYRGDEFALIIPAAGLKEARELAEKVARDLREIKIDELAGPGALPITVSVGIGIYPRDGRSNLELLQRSFELMFMARGDGGDRVLSAADGIEVG